jgi:predicted component of type VI protein secretion system
VAVAERIAKATGHGVRPITVTKMAGDRDVARFMLLAAAARNSTRRMRLVVR